MAVLEVQHLKKVYTTRFGGNRVQALSDVNFSVEKGEYVAIMGESGSGKTTLLNILASLDRPTEGKVLMEGRDMAGIREKDLAAFRRNNLGFVFQDFNLLDTFSIRDNIFLPLVLSRTPYDEMEKRLIPLAEKLGISEILDKYPYEISGGQKQRISIARVFLTNPPILILDEATSALDNESERWIQRSLEELSQNRTTITIAHRLSTIRDADEIIVITEDGIAERGTHEELLDMNGVYAAYYNM